MNIFNRIRNNFRQYGLRVALRRAIARFLSTLFYLDIKIIARCEIDLKNPPAEPLLHVDVLPLKAGDVENLPISLEKKQLFYHRLQDKDNICLTARINGLIGYYAWISTGTMEIHELGEKIPLTDEEGFLFDAECFPDFRGNRLHGFMSWKRLEMLKAKGKKFAYVSYLKDNRVAERVMRSLGFFPIKEVKCLVIFGRWKYIHSRHIHSQNPL